MRVDSEPRPADSVLYQDDGGAAARYCGLSQMEITALTGASRALLFADVSSTMDVAHEAAAHGAPAGTIVLAERQRSGRGRGGRVWRSDAEAGVWLTLIERPWEGVPVELMSIRAGLELAPVLDRFAAAPVGLKWPNDLQVRGRKLAGVLIEARWRDSRAEWVALGVGINLAPPADLLEAHGLRAGVRALDVLPAAVPALRRAASKRGRLSPAELRSFARRDVAAGKRCSEPVSGTVRGIDANGALLVESGDTVVECRTGSLVLEGLR